MSFKLDLNSPELLNIIKNIFLLLWIFLIFNYFRAQFNVFRIKKSIKFLKKENLILIDKINQKFDELKKLNKEINKNYHLVDVILNKHSDLIWILNSELQIIYMNPSALNALNLPLSEVTGKTSGQIFISPSDVEMILEKNLRILKNGQPEITEEEVSFSENKKTFYLTTRTPYKNHEGHIAGIVCISKDITERKKSENLLKESQQKYQKLFENLPVEISLWEIEYEKGTNEIHTWKLLEANPYCLKNWDKKESDIYGKDFDSIFGAGSTQKYFEFVNSTMGKSTAQQCEIYFEPLGKYYYSTSIALGHQFILVSVDITELKQTVLITKKQNTQLKAIFQAVPDGIAVFDMKGKLFLKNKSLTKVTNCFEHEILNKSIQEIGKIFKFKNPDQSTISPQDSPACRVMRGQTLVNELHIGIQIPTNKEIYLNINGCPVLDSNGKQIFSLIIMIDVSKKIHEKKAIAENESHFRKIANNIPQHAWIYDSQDILIWNNNKFYKYTQLTFEDLEIQSWIMLLPPDYRESALKKWLTHLNNGFPWEDTLPLRAHDGAYRWFLCRADPIRDLTGNITQWFGTNTDVTDQLLLQEKLEKTIQARDEFLSIVSHELKTPLTSLKIENQLLFADLKAKPTESYSYESVLKIAIRTEKQINRIERLVNDMLDMTQIRSGNFTLKKQPMSLSDLVYEIIERKKPEFIQAGAPIPELHLCLSAWGNWDKLRLDQVISNLLINTIRYGNKKPVRIELKSDGKICQLIVEDHGIGIPEEKQNSIFNPFERAIDGDSVSGLGLGLFITQQIVVAHEGKIKMESTLGQGSTFTVELPQYPHSSPQLTQIKESTHANEISFSSRR